MASVMLPNIIFRNIRRATLSSCSGGNHPFKDILKNIFQKDPHHACLRGFCQYQL
jgi:hypothetical protein